MAGYTTAVPPQLLVESIGNTAPAIWGYGSSDAIATIVANGYITNGGQLGMKVGDLVFINVIGGLGYSARVAVVSATAPGAVNLGTQTTIGA